MTPGAARNPCSLCGANRRQSARMSGKLVDPCGILSSPSIREDELPTPTSSRYSIVKRLRVRGHIL
jgi:hypothetical protein